jgi:chloride channel 3/4/5
VKGFPVVSSDTSRTLLGYIDRADIRYVLSTSPVLSFLFQCLTIAAAKTRKSQIISPITSCSFTTENEQEHDGSSPIVDVTEESNIPMMTRSGAAFIENDVVNLGPWVNQVSG